MASEQELDIRDDEELNEDELAELMEADRSTGVIGFVGGVLLGTVIGAGIALLVAPERGEVTRRRIRTRLEDLRDDARDQLDDLRDEAQQQVRRQGRKVRRRLKGRV